MSDVVGIGVVGAGAIAQIAHLPVLDKMKGVRVVALCDNDAAKARALAERFDVPNVVTDIEDLLEIADIEAVLITTPNHLHEPHVLSALAARRHVLCERPLALTARGVERILAASQRVNRCVLVANNHRFRVDVQALAGFLRGGELGRLMGIRAGTYQPRRTVDGWRHRRNEAGGGAFLEHGLPLLDLALWLSDFPEPTRVAAHVDRGRGANAVEDSMLVQLETGQGLSMSFDITWSYVGLEQRWWFQLLAARGSASLGPLRVVKELNGRPQLVSPTGGAARESAFVQSYRAELAHFLAVIRQETEYDPPTDQVRVHKLLEAIYRSADDGKEVRL
jgi:predicted dehydrogenase